MTDKLALYDNVMGVFADLDDGGLTDDEALNQIRQLVGIKPALPDVIVFPLTIPATITVRVATGEVTEFEVAYDFASWNVDQPVETRKDGEPIDSAEFGEEINALWQKVFAASGDWPEPERQ